jgi:hypothetical protein
MRSTIPIDRVIETYGRTKSVWKTGAELGISGQSVSAALKRAGVRSFQPKMSEDELQTIRNYYRDTHPDQFKLDVLAQQLGRTKQLICRYAGKMGLTDQSRPLTPEDCKKISINSRRYIAEKGHPRGFRGKRHSSDTLVVLSEWSKESWRRWKDTETGPMTPENRDKRSLRQSEHMRHRSSESIYSRAAAGRRADLGDTYFRSRWEANYARYLNLLMRMGVVTEWAYEPETFWFEGVKRGTVSYKPDFRVMYKDDPKPVYVELKGWVQDKDHTKWKRMAKYHPHIKLEIIAAKEFASLRAKWSSAIPNWERETGKAVVQKQQGHAA